MFMKKYILIMMNFSFPLLHPAWSDPELFLFFNVDALLMLEVFLQLFWQDLQICSSLQEIQFYLSSFSFPRILLSVKEVPSRLLLYEIVMLKHTFVAHNGIYFFLYFLCEFDHLISGSTVMRASCFICSLN